MSKRAGAILLILLTLTIGFTTFIALDNNPNPYYPLLMQTTGTVVPKNGGISTSNLTNSLVLRNISVNNFGIAIVTDTFTVRNDGVDYATIVDIFYPEETWSQLITSTAWFENVQLNIEATSSDGRNGTRIFFDKSLAPGETYTFTLKQYFDETLSTVYHNTLKVNVTQFVFPACPYSPYETEQCNVSVTSPKDAFPLSPLEYNFPHVEPFDNSKVLNISFWFSGVSSIISIRTVYRQIEVDPWTGIKVIETQLIENKGSSNMNKIYTNAPPGTIKFEAYDAAGVLSAWPSGDSITIRTRVSIPPNGTYFYYTVSTIPIAASQIGSSGSYLFTFNILPDYGATIENFYVSLIFKNFQYTSFQNPPTIPISSSTENIFLYAWNDVIPTQKVYFYSAYNIGFPTTYLRPLLFMLIFGITAISYTVIRSRRARAVPLMVRPAEVSASILRDFCDLYEEKNSLILETDSLREDSLRKKIRKAEYSRRVKAVEKDLARLNQQIDHKKTEILDLDRKFASDFNSLELNEADREQAKLALQSLRRRYLLKRLSKETYLKLRDSQEKKLKKAESNIDKKIQDLRREAI